MPSYVTPKKNTQFIFWVGLTDQADVKKLKANPTLAAGDVKVSIDGGAFNNVASLPTITPAAGTGVKVTLSTSEMNGDNIIVAFIDAAGAEWCDLMITIQTTAQQIDDVAATGAAMTLTVGERGTMADAVWDEPLAGHVTAGSAGKQLQDIAPGSAPTAAAIADAVWDEATAGHTTSGTFGEQLKTDVDAILDDTGTAGVVLTAAERNSAADALLNRNTSNVEGSAPKQSLGAAVIGATHKQTSAAGVRTVYKQNDTDVFMTQTETQDASADPVTAVTKAV